MVGAIETIDEIGKHLSAGDNFLLSGGAGSGKTHTLMQVLSLIFQSNPRAKVACITYTNIAVEEIKKRSPHKNLWVSTIHEFLWDNIKNFQKNLRLSLIELINEKIIKYDGELLASDFLSNKNIQYKEYRKLEEGIVWHDDILKLSDNLYKKYPTLCKILCDKYDYILIDEYQDTDKKVVDILLNYLQKAGHQKNTIGFFGDSMQSIYSNTVGNIKSYVDSGLVKEVIKEDNRRCSASVIELLNKIRTDIQQSPANNNLRGSIKFLYSMRNDITIAEVKKHVVFQNWQFDNFEKTKELYLTHRLISKEKGFSELYRLYEKNSDRLLKVDSQDKLIKHLFKIQEIVYLYQKRKYNEFIKKTDFKIYKLSDKKILKEKIDQLNTSAKNNIEEIINLAHTLKLVEKDDNLQDFITSNEEHYNNVKSLPQEQIRNVYDYVNDLTPLSTQHNVKGTEFDNVFVVLDNGGWNLYSFKHLFENTPQKEDIIERTKKLFYVCCSRAKDNLVVFFHNPSPKVLAQAKIWFGEQNVISID